MSTSVTSTSVARRRSRPARQRAVSRSVHLLAGALLVTYVYAPPVVSDPLRIWLQLLVVPVVVSTGLLLGKQATLRRLLHRRAAHPNR